MSQAKLTEEIAGELSAVAESIGCELLDFQFKGGVLRLVIDRSDGVTLDDCQQVSKRSSAFLDVADFGLGRYVLEVTSPGLDREFYRDSDYEKYCGEQVRVTWKEPQMAHKQTVVGTLSEYSAEDREIVLLTASGDEGIHRISLENIQLARLEPEY